MSSGIYLRLKLKGQCLQLPKQYNLIAFIFFLLLLIGPLLGGRFQNNIISLHLSSSSSSSLVPCWVDATSRSLLSPLAESSPPIANFCRSLPLSAVQLCPFDISLNTCPSILIPVFLFCPLPSSVSPALFVNLSSLILSVRPAHRSLLPTTFNLTQNLRNTQRRHRNRKVSCSILQSWLVPTNRILYN